MSTFLRNPRRRVFAAAAAAAMALTVSACGIGSEIATLKPVAGDALAGLNIAANDVLLQKNVDILIAPVCTYSAPNYSCQGKTMDKQEIVVTAVGAEPTTMTVTVGGKTIYDGSLDAVIEKAGQSR